MSMKKTYLTTSPFQTKNLGEKIAREILASPKKEKAEIVGLMGELGSGKTTFLKGFAKGLGIKEKILSPTFIIMRKSKIQNPKSKFQYLYHIDCYRIRQPKEVLELGFKEIISAPQNIVCIEWADKIKKILPQNTIILKFKFAGKNKREILITSS